MCGDPGWAEGGVGELAMVRGRWEHGAGGGGSEDWGGVWMTCNEWEVCGDQANPEYGPGYVFRLYPKTPESEKQYRRLWEVDLLRFAFQSYKLSDSKIGEKKKKLNLFENPVIFKTTS